MFLDMGLYTYYLNKLVVKDILRLLRIQVYRQVGYRFAQVDKYKRQHRLQLYICCLDRMEMDYMVPSGALLKYIIRLFPFNLICHYFALPLDFILQARNGSPSYPSWQEHIGI